MTAISRFVQTDRSARMTLVAVPVYGPSGEHPICWADQRCTRESDGALEDFEDP
jgi:hypothetical protein